MRPKLINGFHFFIGNFRVRLKNPEIASDRSICTDKADVRIRKEIKNNPLYNSDYLFRILKDIIPKKPYF
jgi:hypothetical protein